MDLQSYGPALDQHGMLTHRQALAAGLSPADVARLVRDCTWVRVRKGVYADHDWWTSLDAYRARPVARIHAAALVIDTDGAFSHDSAALLLEMGVPDARTSLVHRTRARVHGTRIRAGIKHHGAPYLPEHTATAGGRPVLGPARTAVDLAREHGREAGVAACDQALRLGVTRAELAAVADFMHCWPGSRAIRTAVELADAGSESWLESLGRMLVTDLGIGRPETQFGLTDGSRTVWCDLRVGRHIFEVDGHLKYLDGDAPDPAALWKEKKRQDFITGFKLGMSRITAHDCGAGRVAALRRLARERADTVARFGTDTADLAPYIVRRPASFLRPLL